MMEDVYNFLRIWKITHTQQKKNRRKKPDEKLEPIVNGELCEEVCFFFFSMHRSNENENEHAKNHFDEENF